MSKASAEIKKRAAELLCGTWADRLPDGYPSMDKASHPNAPEWDTVWNYLILPHNSEADKRTVSEILEKLAMTPSVRENRTRFLIMGNVHRGEADNHMVVALPEKMIPEVKLDVYSTLDEVAKSSIQRNR